MGLRSQTPAKKMKTFIRAVLFMIEIKSAVSKKRFIMNFKLLMDRYKHVERSISNVPPTHNPHHLEYNIKIPSLLNSSSEEEGGMLEEEEEVDIIMSSIPPGLEHVSEQEWRELIMASAHASSQSSDVEGALEGEGSGGSWDVNVEAEEFIRRNRQRMMKENREDFDEISEC